MSDDCCRDIQASLTAYVDGEAAPGDVTAVTAHLAACPRCRRQAAIERTAREVLRTRGPALGESASPALQARCRSVAAGAASGTRAAQRWPGRPGWLPMSAVASVVLALGVVFLAGQHDRLDAAFAAQLALDHARCFAVGFDEDRPVTAQRVAAAGGGDLTLPVESDEFDLLDVRRCVYDGGAMTHILCRWEGNPVSLYVVPRRARGDRMLEVMGHDAIIWPAAFGEYVLIAERGPVDLGEVTTYVRAFTDTK